MRSRKIPIIIGIYVIISPSGAVYVGQSWDIYARWRCHRNEGRTYGYLQRSLRKYGSRKHRFSILKQLTADVTQDDLNRWERFFIRQFRQQGVRLMNLTDGGNNGKPTEEVRQRLRKPKSPEHRANIARAVARQWSEGKKSPTVLSAESREKIRQTMTGRKYSAERVAKASSWERTEAMRSKIAKSLHGKVASQKLTPQQVLEIRAKYVPHKYGCRRLGAEYGVDNKTIWGVVSRKTFSYL